MGAAAGPNVVEDGLVLALDAGNTKSYPGSGTTWTDLSGKDNNGTLTDGPTFNSANGGSIVFDGTNDQINCGSSDDFAFGTGDFTIEFWCNPDTVGTECIIAISSNGGISTTNWQFRYNSSKMRWIYSQTANITSNSTVSAGEWTHVVATRSGTALTLYINAVSEATGTSSADLSDNGTLRLGCSRNQGSYFDGKISNVKLYKGKALTAAEVQQNYNATKNRYNFVWSLPAEELYSFTSAFFTASRALTDSPSSDDHRFGPTQTQVRAWLSGTSNGGGGHSWANTYVDCPQDGYQRWTIPKTGKYRITAKGGGSGHTDSPDDYMLGVKVIADFNLTEGEKLILAAGQGVPDYDGDHCNGGGGASWVMSGSDYATAIPLIVANGAGGDTSDGGAKGQANVTLGNSITVTPTGGEGGGSAVTGKQTTPINSTVDPGRGSQNTSKPNSGGWLSDGNDAGENNVGGHGFRSDLKGGIRSNSTAGNGGFGGGSGGEDESGSAGGGFTGAHGTDNSNVTGHGSSFVNDNNQGNVSVALAQATTTFQNTDYTSEDQYQGWVKIEFIS